jgi:flagellar FliL protein
MSDAPTDPKEPTPAEVALVQPPAKSKLIPILLAVNMAGMVGVGAFAVTKSNAQAAAPAAKKHAPAEGEEEAPAEEEAESGGGEHEGAKKGTATVKLEDFTVRLRNPEADRFARVSFEVEVGSDKDRERLVAAMARVRDAFIGELTERTAEELRGNEGLSNMKATLFKKLKELVPQAHVRGLYITDFIVQ